jgi:hypothetical protein
MVNKEKTIQKMIARYHEILPIPGKKDLHDCFFCLHGQNVIQFRTRDKKVHIEKAYLEIVQEPIPFFNSPLWDSVRKFLTQPVRFGASRGQA